MMEQLRPLGVKTLAQFSNCCLNFSTQQKKKKKSREIVVIETETHSSTSRFADLTLNF